jgi:Barrel-sandwich domain of CusB or HlyD membrane-fusion
VIIEISEGDLKFVREGTTAHIRAEALPDRVFEGQVTDLQPTEQKTPKALADIRLPNRDSLLIPGMSAEVTLVQSPQSDDRIGSHTKLRLHNVIC